MRKGLLSSVATALVGAGSALAQNPYYLPTDATQTGGVPALLSPDQTTPAPGMHAAPPKMDCGSTGLVSGVDCLPSCCGTQRPQFYGDVSYMLMWVKDAPAAGPLAVFAPPAGAALFGPGTRIGIGGDDTTFNGASGIRGTVGMWLGCDRKIGIEGSGFIVQQQDDSVTLFSNGNPANQSIFRPFNNFNTVPATIGAMIVAAPGIPGAINERQTMEIWGAEINGVLNWQQDCHRTTDILAGFGYTDLHETLGVTSATVTPGVGATVLDDAFGTRNQFYAPQVGTRTSWNYNQFTLTMVGKVAAGVNHERVDRLGNTTTLTANGAVINTPGAFLVQASNRGRVTTDKFCVGTPSQVMLSYQVTCNLSAYIGYDFIYLTSVVRPGNQVDATFQTVGGNVVRPAGGFHQTDFWASSLLAGVSWKF